MKPSQSPGRSWRMILVVPLIISVVIFAVFITKQTSRALAGSPDRTWLTTFQNPGRETTPPKNEGDNITLYLPLIHRGAGEDDAPSPTAVTTPSPLGTLVWDARLDQRGATLMSAEVAPGQGYWRLIEARWYDVAESQGKHHIFVEMLDETGNRKTGVPILVEWTTGAATIHTEAKPGEEWATNYGMFDVAPSYSARPDDGVPADSVGAMGLGSIAQPKYKEHTSYGLTWQWTVVQDPSSTTTATPTQGATPVATATETAPATTVPDATATPTRTLVSTVPPTPTSTPIPTQSATPSPSPTAMPTPTLTPTAAGLLFPMAEVGECMQDGSGTRFRGYVTLNGERVAGYSVVWSHERNGRWATNPQVSRENPLGYYEHIIGPPQGDWYAWIVDVEDSGRRISATASFRIEGGCNVRQVDFVGG